MRDFGIFDGYFRQVQVDASGFWERQQVRINSPINSNHQFDLIRQLIRFNSVVIRCNCGQGMLDDAAARLEAARAEEEQRAVSEVRPGPAIDKVPTLAPIRINSN